MVCPCLLKFCCSFLGWNNPGLRFAGTNEDQAAVVARRLRSKKRFIDLDLIGGLMHRDSFGMTRLWKHAFLTTIPTCKAAVGFWRVDTPILRVQAMPTANEVLGRMDSNLKIR
jgi:hypothetical protein